MNLSIEETVKIIEQYIEDIDLLDQFGNLYEDQTLRLEALLKCYQHHLKTFL